jgi:hypothetical protein
LFNLFLNTVLVDASPSAGNHSTQLRDIGWNMFSARIGAVPGAVYKTRQ